MSPRAGGLICAALVLLPTPATWAAPPIRMLGLGGENMTREYVPALPAIFGNRPEKITLSIDGAVAEPAYLQANLFQVAGKLAMPLAKDQHVLEGLTFPNGAAQVLAASIQMPDVKRRTEILVQLNLVPHGSPASPIHLTDIRFDVFPADLTKDLSDLLRARPDGTPQAIVFGPGQKLRHFLAGLPVPFEDGGEGLPSRFDPDRFYLGELATEDERKHAEDRRASARLALFFPDTSLPPGIYADRTSTGILINVNLPMLDHLSDDPLEQLALIKVLRQLTSN